MSKKAKRLGSESRTQLFDCRRLLHIVLFRRALAHFPRAQISPPQHRSDPNSSYARHPLRALDTILRQGMPTPL